MSEDENEPKAPASGTREQDAQLPQCPSTFLEGISGAYGEVQDPKVDLLDAGSDSVEDALSSRVASLRSSSGSKQRYTLQGEIGRGGMGAILKIFDTDLRRNLAMKVVLERGGKKSEREAELEGQQLMRFLEEAQVTGQLDHPGVVPVHELGVDPEGRVYFTMRLVKGQDLSKIFAKVHANDADWSRTRVLSVLLRVCEAMSYAHEKGVVHRDLKPANVMVGRHGAVYVMDWGLARVDGREDSHDLRLQEQAVSLSFIKTDRRDSKSKQADSPLMTMDGDVMGTPFYMPPEQAAGRLADIGPHSDVYALGAMLYHLLTGRMPYHTPGDNASPFTVLAQVIGGPPQPIGELATDVPPELVSICEKAMQPEQAKRYPNMGELAEDLRAFLENRVVQAHRSGAVIELKKWVQRNKALAAMILAFITLSVGGSTTAAVVFGAKNESIRLARDEALEAKGLALREAERATLAEVKAEVRADELKQVADFQSEQLRALDVEVMGTRLRGTLINAAPAERREQLTLNLAGLNFTNLALGTLKENLFDRTIEAIDAQFEDQPLVQAQLLESIASTLHKLGLYSTAIGPQQRALSIRQEELGDDHPDTLMSKSNMGEMLKSMSKDEEALPYCTEALDGCRRVLGNDHPGTLLGVGNMGALLLSMGRIEEALPYFTEALEGMRRVLGDDHPDTLGSVNNMGAVLKSMGELEQAMPYYTEALDGMRRVLGGDHPDTQTCLGNLGALLHSMGKLEEALPYCTEALELKRRVLGDDHPTTLLSVGSLGVLLESMGRLELAMPYFSEALEGMRRVLGTDHPDTLGSVSNMGGLLKSMGKLEQALPYYTEALEGRRRVLGGEHPDTLSSVSKVGVLLNSMGKPDEALPYCSEALEVRRRVLGDEHPNTLNSVSNVGIILKSSGQLKEALPYYTEALEGDRRWLGDDHPTTLASVNSMGSLLFSMGRIEEALPYLTEGLERRRLVLGDDHPDTLTSVNNMGFILRSMGKLKEATLYFTEALEGERRVLGDDHPQTIDAREQLVEIYGFWVAKLLREHGEDHPLVLMAQRNQAISFATSNREEQAEALLLACLDKRLEHQGEEHPDTLQLFHDLATLYAQQDRSDESEGMFIECLALREEALGESHPMALESLEGLVRLYTQGERYEEAAPLAKRLLSLTIKDSPTLVGRQKLLQLIEAQLKK
jgi:tetratricopeptide (TPR) repeat protein/serine/threonine protein kinase